LESGVGYTYLDPEEPEDIEDYYSL